MVISTYGFDTRLSALIDVGLAEYGEIMSRELTYCEESDDFIVASPPDILCALIMTGGYGPPLSVVAHPPRLTIASTNGSIGLLRSPGFPVSTV